MHNYTVHIIDVVTKTLRCSLSKPLVTAIERYSYGSIKDLIQIQRNNSVFNAMDDRGSAFEAGISANR